MTQDFLVRNLYTAILRYFSSVNRVGQKSKLLILGEYVNKTEKIEGT